MFSIFQEYVYLFIWYLIIADLRFYIFEVTGTLSWFPNVKYALRHLRYCFFTYVKVLTPKNNALANSAKTRTERNVVHAHFLFPLYTPFFLEFLFDKQLRKLQRVN